MIRTRVSLSEEEYSAAKREAQRLGISLAELLRRSRPGRAPYRFILEVLLTVQLL